MRSVLVFRIGSLGDTIASLPALWVLREVFSSARITLLYDHHPRLSRVDAHAVLGGSSLADEYLRYPVDASRFGGLIRPARLLRLLTTLRRRAFDALVYLAPTIRSQARIDRDRRFFEAAGIRTLIGMDAFPELPARIGSTPLPTVSHEADFLLARLAASGLPVPAPGLGRMDMDLRPDERREVVRWLSGLPPDGARPWIGIGPGAKQPVNVWPAERYRETVRQVMAKANLWPVVFGGEGDRPVADELIQSWGRGYNAAGALSVRAAAAAMERCVLFLGNDTGTIHLAAAAKVPCVGIYSSRNSPGWWDPYGVRSTIFRTDVDCEGCLLSECLERRMECILRIEVEAVAAACLRMIEELPS